MRRQIKSLIVGLAGVLFFSSSMISCSKDNTGSDRSTDSTFIYCTMDGAMQSFSNATRVDTLTVANVLSLRISGYTNNSNKETLQMQISNTVSAAGLPIGAGTYTDTSAHYNLSAYYLLATSATASVEYDAGTGVASRGEGSGSLAAHPFSIVIQSISNGYVTGTFGGDFFLDGDPAAAKKSITGGTFHVKIN